MDLLDGILFLLTVVAFGLSLLVPSGPATVLACLLCLFTGATIYKLNTED